MANFPGAKRRTVKRIVFASKRYSVVTLNGCDHTHVGVRFLAEGMRVYCLKCAVEP